MGEQEKVRDTTTSHKMTVIATVIMKTQLPKREVTSIGRSLDNTMNGSKAKYFETMIR